MTTLVQILNLSILVNKKVSIEMLLQRSVFLYLFYNKPRHTKQALRRTTSRLYAQVRPRQKGQLREKRLMCAPPKQRVIVKLQPRLGFEQSWKACHLFLCNGGRRLYSSSILSIINLIIQHLSKARHFATVNMNC